MATTNGKLTNAYRSAVASRVAAALVGGYAFANAVAVFVAQLLPMSTADAALAMTLASFALYTAAVIWVFAARSATRAWVGLLVPTVVCGGSAALRLL